MCALHYLGRLCFEVKTHQIPCSVDPIKSTHIKKKKIKCYLLKFQNFHLLKEIIITKIKVKIIVSFKSDLRFDYSKTVFLPTKTANGLVKLLTSTPHTNFHISFFKML